MIDELYKIRTLELDKSGLHDARYGNGKFSNFELLQNESSVIKKAKYDLVKIMEEAVKAKIFINEKAVAEAESTNVLGHELLHYVMSRAFKVDDASMQPLVDSFKDYLNKSVFNAVNNINNKTV